MAHRPGDGARRDGEDDGVNCLVDADTPISAVMTGDLVGIREDTSAETLRALFRSRRITAIPVVDAAGRPVGMISQADLGGSRPSRADSAMGGDTEPVGVVARTVGEIMDRSVFALPMRARLAQAAALFARVQVSAIAVLGLDGVVAGVLSPFDLARWIAEQTGRVSDRGAPATATCER